MCHSIKEEMEKQQAEPWWWCTGLMNDSSLTNRAPLLTRRQTSAPSLGSAQYSRERETWLHTDSCVLFQQTPPGSRDLAVRMEIEGECLPCMPANGHFAPSFVGPWFLSQLSNAFGSFYCVFNCNKLAPSVIWHLKPGIKAGGNSSLK